MKWSLTSSRWLMRKETVAAVINKAGDKAAISFNTQQLPVLTLWKNTDTLKQGYVTGLNRVPATPIR
jgi:hypothetical protein